jgi:hypothetical protein
LIRANQPPLGLLPLSLIVVASLVGYAQGSYYCYLNWNNKSGYAGKYWYYISAWAYGCFYVPSDGNLYDTWGGGSGFTDAPSATVSISVNYDERGCAGDVFRVRTSISIDTNGDGIPDHRDSVESAVRAPPCGAT